MQDHFCGTWDLTLQHTDFLVVALRLSCSLARRILVSPSATESTFPALQDRFLTTGPPGSTLVISYRNKSVTQESVCVYILVARSCLILRNPRDCSQPGSSVHGILQARILEWVPKPLGKSWRSPRPLLICKGSQQMVCFLYLVEICIILFKVSSLVNICSTSLFKIFYLSLFSLFFYYLYSAWWRQLQFSPEKQFFRIDDKIKRLILITSSQKSHRNLVFRN